MVDKIIFDIPKRPINSAFLNGASGTPVELPAAFLSGFRRFPVKMAELVGLPEVQ
jgi:hypothetical protein